MDDHTVLGRASAILEAVGATSGPSSLAKLATETGIPKPTVRRIANQLVAQRILCRDPRGYRLGLRLIDLGVAAASQLGTAEFAAPYVHELHERTGQIAWVCTFDGDALVVLDKAFAREHSAIIAAHWDPRMPIAAAAGTAAGRLLLSAQPAYVEQVLRSGGPPKLTPHTVTSPRMLLGRLQRVADTGVAHEWEENRLGWWCAAVLVPAPAANYVFGLTAETRGVPMARGITQVQRIAEHFGRELTLAADKAN
ncbi:helix-turn-helix domain-containing protein [Streptomyces sp. NPDC002133]|uniref:IclR family transcriptional regulator n=1 Tax=Streptomyces sp. NPDC002133 TaxID=3154409 RepID=UPI0033184282